MRTGIRLLFSGLPLLALLAPAAARAEGEPNCRPFYLNTLYDPAYTGGGCSLTQTLAVTFFSGSTALTTNTYPSDGVVRLKRSVIGQPVGGADYRIPGDTFIIGQVIQPATNLNVRPGAAPYSISPSNYAAFISGPNKVYAAYEGDVEIRWIADADGREMSPITYRIEVPPDTTNRAKLYHTHTASGNLVDDSGRIPEAPHVSFPVSVTPVIHYNPRIPYLADSNSPVLRFDSNRELRAKPTAQGYILFEYRNETNGFLGVEPVLVKANDPDVGTTAVDIGFQPTPWTPATNAVAPFVGKGLGGLGSPSFVYQHPANEQQGQVWAERATSTADEIIIYWRKQGVAAITWPYELHHYTANWPTDPARFQLYVRGSTTNLGPDVVLPSGIIGNLREYQNPTGHAELTGDRFTASRDGWSLLKYLAGQTVSFQVVKSVLHTDSGQFNLTAADWPIGVAITNTSHQGPRSGYIHVLETKSPKEDRYHYQIYHGATNQLDRPPGFDWITNRVYAVNEGALEVWWSNVNTNGNVQWPSLVKRYNNVWPATASPIVIASQVGSGPLPSADANIYFQNDAAKPGYNPNDEHALLLPQHGPAELHLEVFPTAVNVLEGAWASARITLPAIANAGENLILTIAGSRDGTNDLVGVFLNGATVTNTLVLEPQSWTTPQTVYFTVATNALPLTNGIPSNLFTLRASGAFFDTQTIQVRAVPTNAPTLFLDVAALRLPEGESRSFNVGLTRPPGASVQVDITQEAGGPPGLSAQPVLLTFTPQNWSNAQPVTISSAPGATIGEASAQFRLTASGGLSVVKTVDVTFLGSGQSGQAAYALRDDLGDPPGSASLQYSEPYVLVTYTDGAGLRQLKVYQVTEGNFTYPGTAGRLIQPPYPLSIYNGWEGPAYATNSPAAWEDRKKSWWARSAGDNDGMANIVMKFFYPTNETFFFPPGTRPTGTNWVPWLDRRFASPTPGIPVDVVFQIRWPTDVPKLLFGESLVKAKFGLPTIKGQTSVDFIYEQTERQGYGTGSSAKLIDAGRTYEAPLANLPGDTVGKTVTTLTAIGEIPPGSVFFTPLPPHLRSRVWWEGPAGAGKLKFKGEFVDEFGTAEPVGYLLLNVLTDRDTNYLCGAENPLAVSHQTSFLEAVATLRSAANAGQVRIVPTNTLQGAGKTFALTAGLARKDGYVTLAFNNVIALTNGLGAERGTPVSLEIVRVTCPSYRGETKVIYPQDPFDERVNLRHSGDFAGQADGYEFNWQKHPFVAGQVRPPADSPLWLGDGLPQGFGVADHTVGGTGAQSLSDWWYRCCWRTTNAASPCGTGFTDWTGPTLVEGWIKRVLGRINMFDQRYTNYVNVEVNTIASLLSGAGSRWIGSVPLNGEPETLNALGLIELYETVLKRGIELSIEGNPPLVGDEGVSRALLMAASQLGNLYMLFGNEAYADAADPTIGFVTTGAGNTYFGVESTSKHCFMGQVDSLLEEELTLLRGLGDTNKWDLRRHPEYNRLRPNTDPRFPEAVTVYMLNYGLRDPGEAEHSYPQGHGDAWGHYLMAIKNYYRLLRNPNFKWLVTDESATLQSGTVRMNYQYERRFAAIAAAKARTGAELVNLTYRSRYVENPDGQWQGYLDANTNRAWGLAEWASRAGEGAYYDWVVGNALLPPTVTVTNQDQLKVDRTTVTELREVAGAFTTIQEELDKADAGLNPLGLSKNVIPFDIDPVRVDAGETHFEQIYGRAVKAMNNAIGVFNRAQTARQKLREQADDVNKFRDDVYLRENDFTNRLIEVFGYPYPDDPAYDASANVPDLYHFMYSDYSDITGEVTPPLVQFTVQFGDLVVSPRGELTRVFTPVVYHTAANGFGLVKPPYWTQPRRAPGEIQMAHSELLQSAGRFKRALLEYENLLAQIEDQSELLRAQYNLNATEINVFYTGMGTQESLNSAIKRSRIRQLAYQTAARLIQLKANAVSETAPKVMGVIVGTSSGVIMDPGVPVRGAANFAATIATELLSVAGNVETIIELDYQQAKESASARQNIVLTTLRQEQAILQQVAQIEQLVRQETLLRLEIYNQQEAVQQAAGRYASTLARGQRLIEERTRFRQLTASDVRQYRYKDMAFRIFRDEAIQQYRAQFDLAGRYVYLAAAAFDYETNLRDTETRWKPGTTILTDIVRARSIGVIDGSGNPQPGPATGNLGDGGLAAAMWNLNHNWNDGANSLKTQLGFNNPARETLTFQLRAGLFRALTNDFGDASWRAWLNSCVVPHVGDIPEFQRYCKPPSGFGQNGPEPGIVIPFTSAIKYRHNFFGWPETGGGANFSSSYFATKIKSTAVKFIGYNANPGALNSSPHVYLVPVGNDVLLAPIPTGVAAPTREWKILDQFLPAPLPLNLSSFPSPAWIPIAEMDRRDAQDVSFLSIRRYSQMRAYHDSSPNGIPTNPELEAYRRLIGRSAWNTRWLLIVLGGDLLGSNPNLGIQRFINGVNNDGEGVTDIELNYSTYSYPGNSD